MEAYKTICPEGHLRYWTGRKTYIGLTQEQLERVRDNEMTCWTCGSKEAITELDRESDIGQAIGEQYEFMGKLLGELINKKLKERE